MQAVKDKINEIGAMKKVKEEARAEERAEKEIAKARADVAHEVRLAKEAEAAMSLHVAKAGEIARAGDKAAHEHEIKAKHAADGTNTTHGHGASPSELAGAGGHPAYKRMP
ncbi:unnamed protein product [Malus baccata var. baccata]|uniref:Uncharacterized protein n=1 Tax=Malus baccata TaxID=106549 RepID=A0A540NDE8_MALBA|nr:late embryogenesis abundant protein 6-like [Malus domestica]TQE09056.1 hypothetical protein C1H46_005439 [Malus baccata]